MYFFFFILVTLSSCTPVLWPFYWWHTLYLFLFYIYDDVCCYSPTFPCVVFFSLFIYMFLVYAILSFCFTLRCFDEFCFKCFRKISCQSLSCYELSSCKVFQEFMLGLDFIVFNKWLWVQWFITSLILHLFLWFCHGLPNGKIVRTYMELVRTYVIVNWLILWQNALYL